MPPLPLIGVLLDTAGAALKAVRHAGAKDASAAASPTGDAPQPFARTLQQSVAAQQPAVSANAPSSAASAASPTASSAASGSTSGSASTLASSTVPSNRTRPQASADDKTHDDSTTVNPDAAALAAAAAVQAQLLARPDAAPPATASVNGDPANTAQQTLAGQAATALAVTANATKDAVQPGAAAPATSRDALHAALDKLSGSANVLAAPATGIAAPQDSTTPAATPLTSPTPKAPTFDKTLADAKSALTASSAQTPSQAPAAPPLQADVAKTDTPHALAATQDATDAARATLAAATAAATAAAQPSLLTSAAAGAAAHAHALAPRVGTADWTEALSQKVVFLSNAHQQSVELTLNPPDLGPLQVVLRVADNHAHALFVSQHAQVREAVEAALPKLRDAMEAGGLGLGSATVSDGGFSSPQQQNPQQTFAGGQPSRRGSGAPSTGSAPVDVARSAATVATSGRAGLVDTFA